jgi:hypothetical protein
LGQDIFFKKDRGEDALFGDVSRQSTELKDPLQSSTGSTHLKKTKSPKIDEGKPKEENVEPNTALEEPPASISKKKNWKWANLRMKFFWMMDLK